MIYIKLFLTFFKVGLFSFGGGYAMIPLIQHEIFKNNWLSLKEFFNIIAISEMTPGPIAINTATFVGNKTINLLGGLVATIGVAAPSFILVLILAKFFYKFQENIKIKQIFLGIRPVIVGLIFSAAIFISETCIFKENITLSLLTKICVNPMEILDFKSILIFITSLCLLKFFKLHPIYTILISGVLGITLYC